MAWLPSLVVLLLVVDGSLVFPSSTSAGHLKNGSGSGHFVLGPASAGSTRLDPV